MARGRKRLMLGWGLAGLALSISSIGAASTWRSFTIRCGRIDVIVESGAAILWEWTLSTDLAWPSLSVKEPRYESFRWTLGSDAALDTDSPGLWSIGIARRRTISKAFRFTSPPKFSELLLWPVVAVLGLPAAAALWSGGRAARRARAGLCPACGYDRRCLPPTNPCPECGALPPAPTSDGPPSRTFAAPGRAHPGP